MGITRLIFGENVGGGYSIKIEGFKVKKLYAELDVMQINRERTLNNA